MRTYLLFPALLMLLSATSHAQVYRWVDENGVVNSTQQKPEGRDAQTVKQARSPRSAPVEAEAPEPEKKLTEEQQRMLSDLQAKEAERQQQISEIRQSNCEKSRKVLDRLLRSDRIRVRDSGEERVMPEDERQRRINEAQEGIATNCSPS